MGKVIETVVDSIAIEILDKNAILTGKLNKIPRIIKANIQILYF